MQVSIFCAECDEGTEHESAWRLLALTLKQVYGIEKMPRIEREAGGKPFFPERSDICFNLSHSHGAVACAVHDAPVGVDIERLRHAPRRLAGELNDWAFFRRWTAKEASSKRDGRGIAALLRDFEPDALCRTFDDLLPGWIITVCPSVQAEILCCVEQF